jgi:hypothetical protein
MSDTTTTRPAAGGSYIREKDGSIHPEESAAPQPQSAEADATNGGTDATDALDTKPGAQPKKRK